MHTTAFRALGIPGILLPWELSPEQVPEFIRTVRLLDIRGCCITIPNKQAVLPLVDACTDQARAVGAANTLYRDGDKICAHNTDVAGFVTPLASLALDPSAPVLLLGAGGASRAAVVGLQQAGMRTIYVTSHSNTTAAALADEFGLHPVGWEGRGSVDVELIVNTTPLGMTGKFVNETPFAKEWFSGRTGVVYDTIYTPLETRLLREAKQSGWRTVDGLGMFIAQAEHQFSLWTGATLPDEAIQAVTAALYGPNFDASVVRTYTL